MKTQAVLSMLVLPLAVLVQGQGAASGDPSAASNTPASSSPGTFQYPQGDDCLNCQKGPASVCDTCTTTLLPYTSYMPQQYHAWTETKVMCTGTPPPPKACQTHL